LGFPLHLVHVKFLASELQVGKTSRQVDIWGYDHYESRQFNRFRESRVQPHNRHVRDGLSHIVSFNGIA